MAVAVLSCPVSCSVKEDRTECPVYVTVLTDQFLQRGLDEGVVSFAAERPLHREQILFLRYVRQGYEQACPRDFARVSVLSGLDQGELGGQALTFPPGRQADLVWAYATSFSAWADTYVVDAEPHKQYCLIRFLFDIHGLERIGKGTKLYVTGRVRYQKYTGTDGVDRIATDILANRVEIIDDPEQMSYEM